MAKNWIGWICEQTHSTHVNPRIGCDNAYKYDEIKVVEILMSSSLQHWQHQNHRLNMHRAKYNLSIWTEQNTALRWKNKITPHQYDDQHNVALRRRQNHEVKTQYMWKSLI
jgi:hypothetical protein